MQMRRWIVRSLITSLFVIVLPVSMAAETKGSEDQKPKEVVPPAQQITLEQIDSYVKHYAGFGMHRAGSRIDRRAAIWIKKSFKKNKLEFLSSLINFAVLSLDTQLFR